MSKLKWFSPHLAVACAQSTEAKCEVDNEDVVEQRQQAML